MPDQLIVLKLGGSVLRDESALSAASEEVGRWARGHRVIAVVSAFHGETDRLLAQGAATPAAAPCPHALAALASIGELRSGALLCLELRRSGVEAELLDPAGAALRTRGEALEATPVDIELSAVRAVLRRSRVLVFPGFAGRDEHGRTTLLGRGGSDLTALFLAARLDARCRLIKDVDGLYDRDPGGLSGGGAPARRLERASWSLARQVGGRVIQRRALDFAEALGVEFEIAAPGSGGGSVIGRGEGRPKRRGGGWSSERRADPPKQGRVARAAGA